MIFAGIIDTGNDLGIIFRNARNALCAAQVPALVSLRALQGRFAARIRSNARAIIPPAAQICSRRRDRWPQEHLLRARTEPGFITRFAGKALRSRLFSATPVRVADGASRS